MNDTRTVIDVLEDIETLFLKIESLEELVERLLLKMDSYQYHLEFVQHDVYQLDQRMEKRSVEENLRRENG